MDDPLVWLLVWALALAALILGTCFLCAVLPGLLVAGVTALAAGLPYVAVGLAQLALTTGRKMRGLAHACRRPYIEWRNRRRLIRAIRLAPMQQRQALKQVELALAHGAQLMDEAADPALAKRREWHWWSR